MTQQRNDVGGPSHRLAGFVGRPARALALVGILAGVLAGCQMTTPTSEVIASHDYRLRHPIVISEQAETFDIPVGAETRSLSPRLAEAVQGFAREARENGNGNVEILVPSGALNEGAAHSVAGHIRRNLVRGGISAGRVNIRAYPVGDPGAVAPIRVAYGRVKAAVHACGRWTESLASNSDNSDYPDFGCATQSNLASMVANPADLLRPRTSGPADRMRRDQVFDKYRQGTSPSGKYDEGVGAKVSDVGN